MRRLEPEVSGKGVVDAVLVLEVADRVLFRGEALDGVGQWHGLLRVIRLTIPCGLGGVRSWPGCQEEG